MVNAKVKEKAILTLPLFDRWWGNASHTEKRLFAAFCIDINENGLINALVMTIPLESSVL